MAKTFILSLFVFVLFAFASHRLMPFTFLKDKPLLVLQKNKFPKTYIDTLSKSRINELSELKFERKNFDVGQYGVTPDYAINVLEHEHSICLLSIWQIEGNKLAININHLEKNKFYSGFVIDKVKFESLFNFVQKN